MRLVSGRALRAFAYEEPPDVETWRAGAFGLSPLASRVATYAGLVMFLAVNAYLIAVPDLGLLFMHTARCS
jgi:hypothetical protein